MSFSVSTILLAVILQAGLPQSRSTITVTTTADDLADNGNCTLREAIHAASTNRRVDSCGAGQSDGVDVIGFSIPGSAPFTIQLFGALPELTEPLEIDGSTQTGFITAPLVELDGCAAGLAYGLVIATSNAGISHLSITNFGLSGIHVHPGAGVVELENVTIAGNYIGIHPDGTSGPNYEGITATNIVDLTIGGSTHSERNIIASNAKTGIRISEVQDCLIRRNYVGLTPDGRRDYESGGSGIIMHNASACFVFENVISGNKGSGLEITGISNYPNRIQKNHFGVDPNGNRSIGNSHYGIRISNSLPSDSEAATANVIYENVISGNGMDGLLLSDARDQTIVQNFVGTDRGGLTAIDNGNNGITVLGASSEKIYIGTDGGGYFSNASIQNDKGLRALSSKTFSEFANLVSGNINNGIAISGNATSTVISDNLIGTQRHGTSVLPNGNSGIWISDADSSKISDNLISGNGSASTTGGNGIWIQNSIGTTIKNNLIGTDASGEHPLPNRNFGIRLGDLTSASQLIGNIIAFNHCDGIRIDGIASVRNRIHNNSIFENGGIGIDLDGDGPTPNDPLDFDLGPNHIQNFPEIARIDRYGSHSLRVTYSIPSLTEASRYPIEVVFYLADVQNQEGKTLIAIDSYEPASDGHIKQQSFHYVFPSSGFVVATATDALGSTSEFSFPATPIIDVTDTKSDQLPEEFVIDSMFPNPFAESATFGFTSPVVTNVTVRIYDMLGRTAGTLFEGPATPGKRMQVEIPGHSLPNGTYLLRLEAASFTHTEIITHVQ